MASTDPHGPGEDQFEIPAHVAPELVFDYDFISDARLSPDPFAGTASLVIEAPPIFYTPRRGGHWVAASHEAAFEVARNSTVFSSKRDGFPLIPILFDPPEHTAYRAVLVRMFSPASVKKFRTQLRDLAIQLIDAVIPEGRCDFVAAVGEPLPVLMFMRLLGIPDQHLRVLRDMVVTSNAISDSAVRNKIFNDILLITRDLIEARRRQPEDDLITALIDTSVDGRPITFEEVQSYVLMLVVAGLDTVVNAISFAVWRLAADHALQSRFRNEPQNFASLLEDMLRRYSPVTPTRVVREDFSIGKAKFRRGDEVLVHYPSASADPSAYADPERIDETRREPALTFGVGPHRCVGSHLARLEIEIVLEEWLARAPAFSLDPQAEAAMHAAHVMSMTSLPLIWANAN
jgi:cytochrome P450